MKVENYVSFPEKLVGNFPENFPGSQHYNNTRNSLRSRKAEQTSNNQRFIDDITCQTSRHQL